MNSLLEDIAVLRIEDERFGSFHYTNKLFNGVNVKYINSRLSAKQILAQIREMKITSLNIQMEYKTFGSSFRSFILLPFLVFVSPRDVKKVITLHGIISKESIPGKIKGNIIRGAYKISVKICSMLSSHFIVHSEAMKGVLKNEYGIMKNISVIQHGSDYRVRIVENQSGGKILFFGFIRPSKGLETLISSFDAIAQEFPHLTLLIAGSAARNGEDVYIQKVKELISGSKFSSRINFIDDYVGPSNIDSLAEGAKILVLPYVDNFVEVSGVLHDFSQYGIPVICSDTNRFKELENGVNCIKFDKSANGLSNSIRLVMKDDELRRTISDGIFEFGKQSAWATVRAKYMKALSGEII